MTRPIPPGGLRLVVPTPDDWVRVQDGSRRSSDQNFACKPLACYYPSTASVASAKTLARHPDPRALERLAKVLIPKFVAAQSASALILSDGSEKTDLLRSNPISVKGFPAVALLTRTTKGKTTFYSASDIIFAGPQMITIKASSAKLEDTAHYLATFLDAVQIIEGPPMSGAGQVPSQPSISAPPSAGIRDIRLDAEPDRMRLPVAPIAAAVVPLN